MLIQSKRPFFRRALPLLAALLTACASLPGAAESFKTYSYNSWDEPVETPDAYVFERAVTGESLGIARLGGPTDCFVSAQGEVYLLDPPTNRIVVLNRDLTLSREITAFTRDGEASPLKEASGLFVTEDGAILIADKGNNRVIRCTQQGEILREYGRPDSALYPADVSFLPSKVLMDTVGNVYILVEGLYYGAVIYDADGGFQGFYGSNRVKITAQVLADYVWKKIMTGAQKEQLARYIPVSYTNMAIDGKNFIYTCTGEEVRKLNPGGKDVLRAKPTVFFGDISVVYEQGKPVKTVIADIDVEDGGIINVLDATRGRIFQYDAEANLLYAFGGIGGQDGTFRTPAAIASLDGRLLVLDTKKAGLTVFAPTPFGETVRRAVALHTAGKFDEAMEPWQEVLRADANYDMAYVGIGKALYNLGEFGEAMECFRSGGDRYNYSIAKREYRREALGQNFGLIATGVLLLCVLIVLLIKRKSAAALFRRLRRRNGKEGA